MIFPNVYLIYLANPLSKKNTCPSIIPQYTFDLQTINIDI